MYFNQEIATYFATVLSVYLACIYFSRSKLISVLFSGTFICSDYFLHLPRVSYVAVTVLLLGMIVVRSAAKLSDRLALTALLSLVLCFIRPEYVLAFYLAAVALGVSILAPIAISFGGSVPADQTLTMRLRGWLPFYLVMTLAVCSVFSFPRLEGGERAMGAFEQHYAWRWVQSHESTLNPWLNYRQIIEVDFPEARTEYEAALENPSAWLRFVFENVRGIIPAIAILFETKVTESLVLLFISISAIAFIYNIKAINLKKMTEFSRNIPLLECAILALPPIISMILVYPRSHYAIILIAVLLPLVFASVRRVPWLDRYDNWPALLLAAGIAVSLVPLERVKQPNLALIVALRNVDLPVTRLLETDGGWCTYLMPRCTWVRLNDEAAAAMSALEFVRSTNVDAIMVSPTFMTLLHDRNDHSLDEVIGGEGADWRSYHLDTEHRLLVRITKGS